MANILIIDDDPKICLFLSKILERMGHNISTANTLEGGLHSGTKNKCDLIMLDLELPDGNGLQILPELIQAPSSPEVIIITGTGDIRGAEIAFKYGAWDYVQKPFVMDEVSLPITRALQYRQEKETAKTSATFHRAGIIGESSVIRSCLADVSKASVTDSGVLITGETGTGKDLFARAAHENSKRSTGNFVVVDCGAIPETLSESTLFGYEKGAFTGADKNQPGIIAQAEGGTLFLDEIGDLSLNIQKSLLRVLQERTIRPIGGKREIPVDFRLVAATNRDLDQMVNEKTFRMDLLYRIRTIEIKLPPLRNRENDVQEIAIRKIQEIGQRYNIGIKGVSPEFIEILNSYNWPGNVRELINVLEYALASSRNDSTLFPKHLPPELRIVSLNIDSDQTIESEEVNVNIPDIDEEFLSLSDYRASVEKIYFQRLLKKSNGNHKEACRLSGVSKSRLYSLLKQYSLSLSKPS